MKHVIHACNVRHQCRFAFAPSLDQGSQAQKPVELGILRNSLPTESRRRAPRQRQPGANARRSPVFGALGRKTIALRPPSPGLPGRLVRCACCLCLCSFDLNEPFAQPLNRLLPAGHASERVRRAVSARTDIAAADSVTPVSRPTGARAQGGILLFAVESYPPVMTKVRRPSRYGLAIASTRASTRMILSTVSTSGVAFPFSRRLSVSGRTPARRGRSAYVKPADFLRRMILRVRQSAKAEIAFSEPRCPRTSPRRGKPDFAEIQVPRRRSSNSRSRAACSSLKPPSSSSGTIRAYALPAVILSASPACGSVPRCGRRDPERRVRT